MTDRKELQALAAKLREHGGIVHFYSGKDGRLEAVAVANVPGIGPGCMGLIFAAEQMRAAVARLAPPSVPYVEVDTETAYGSPVRLSRSIRVF